MIPADKKGKKYKNQGTEQQYDIYGFFPDSAHPRKPMISRRTA
jgi:hypothetical protein